MAITKQAVEIYRNDGIWKLLTSASRFIIKHMYWSYFQMKYHSACDYDTEKIARVKISPDKIKHKVLWTGRYVPHSGEHSGDNALVGELVGNWDLVRKPISETNPYKNYSDALEKGKDVELLRSLNKNGYRPQQEIENKTRIIQDVELPDEPQLAVDRNNKPLRWDCGNHRIPAAQLLGLDWIYAYVVIWHPDADRKQFLQRYGHDEQELEI